jgi:aryl-alcohol dehydrogenase-like predicted oxidoreductase
MRFIELGQSKLKVGRLFYGTEPFNFKKGPDGDRTQGDKTPEQAAEILKEALEIGVNVWDTSDDYGTHPHIKEALTRVKRSDVYIADKSNALSEEDGWRALDYSNKSLDTDYVDIMFLHNVMHVGVDRKDASGKPYRSGTLQERMGALKAWIKAKESGRVRATALSTHNTKVLRQVLEVPEIDVVCTTLNMAGAVIDDGTLTEHIDAIRALKEDGRGVYVIKILNAGRLRDSAEDAIRWAYQFYDIVDAWNIGMYDMNDVYSNIAMMEEVLPS